jgi:hypothetical protein
VSWAVASGAAAVEADIGQGFIMAVARTRDLMQVKVRRALVLVLLVQG